MDDDAEDRLVMRQASAELNVTDRVTIHETGLGFQKDWVQLRALTPSLLMIVLDHGLGSTSGAAELSLLRSDLGLFAVPVMMHSAGMSATQQKDCLANGAVQCVERGSTYGE